MMLGVGLRKRKSGRTLLVRHERNVDADKEFRVEEKTGGGFEEGEAEGDDMLVAGAGKRMR